MKKEDRQILKEVKQAGLDNMVKMQTFIEHFPDAEETPRVKKALDLMERAQRNRQREARAKELSKEKARIRMKTVYPQQQGVCSFVWVEFKNSELSCRKWDGCIGVQVENIVYLENGKYKYLNKKGIQIKTRYKEAPKTANSYLRELYKNQQAKLQDKYK